MKNVKCLMVLVLLFLFTHYIYPEVVKTFPELLKPDGIFVDGNRMIVKEKVTVYVFSLKDFSIIKKFGRKGEGPEEFKDRINWIGFRKDFFYVASRGKISYFTMDGNFIKEKRAISTSGWGFDPFGNQFLGSGYRKEGNTIFRTINIYDSQLKIMKEVFKKEHDYQEGKGLRMFTAPQNFGTCDNKIFIAFSNDFVIDAFDHKGDKIFSINREYEKLRVKDQHKKEVLNFFKTNPETKERYDWYKQNLKFPSYFPAIRYLYPKDRLLYIRTYKKIDKKTETFIFDMEGKLVKKVLLPVFENNVVEYYSMSISNGKLYQLIENEDTEVWELHITEIE